MDVISVNEALKIYFNCDEEAVVDMFLNGYCFEYYKILKNLYPEVMMVLEKDKSHCASLDKEVVYDVSGFRPKSEFIIPNSLDDYFVDSFYHHFSDDELNKMISFVKNKVPGNK